MKPISPNQTHMKPTKTLEHNHKAQERERENREQEIEKWERREKREDKTNLRIKESLGGNKKVIFMFTFVLQYEGKIKEL